MDPEFDINLDVIDNDKKDVSANNKKDNELSVSRDCIFDVLSMLRSLLAMLAELRGLRLIVLMKRRSFRENAIVLDASLLRIA